VSFSLSAVFRPAEAAVPISKPPFTEVFGDDDIRKGAMTVVGQGSLTTGWRGQGWAHAPCG
jgi:hypothetical protein